MRQIDLNGALAGLPTFAYTGVSWAGEIIVGRLMLVAAGALIALLAALAENEGVLPGAGS